MGLGKLIKDLTTWSTHTQKHWIEVQNENENTSKKAELDWRVLRSMGVKVTTLSIDGDSRVRYAEIPLGGGVYLVTVTADIAPNTPITSTNTEIPVGLRPRYNMDDRLYFLTSVNDYPNIAIHEDRKVLASMQVFGDINTGTGSQASGRVRIYSQHTHGRTISISYISNVPAGSEVSR